MVAHVDFIGYTNFGSHIRCKQLPHGTIHMERIVTIFDFYSNIMIPGGTSRMKRIPSSVSINPNWVALWAQ
jgi:hypothetical protein